MNCPHCDKPITSPAALTDALGLADFTASEFNLASALTDAFPRPVSFEVLIFAIWGQNNEPENSRDDLNSHVSRARNKLKPYGWTIKSMRFFGYRIQKLEAVA